MNYTIIIPARLASTRLPNKALALIGDKAMIVHVALAARQSAATRVVVATDSEQIVEVLTDAGIESVMTDSGHPTGTDRLAQASNILGLDDDDCVVNWQGDEPLMPASVADQVAQRLLQTPGNAMATAVHPIRDARDFANPNVVKAVLDRNDNAIAFSRAPIPWHRDSPCGWSDDSPHFHAWHHLGIYAYRVSFLRSYVDLTPAPIELAESLEQLRALWHGFQIGVIRLDHAPPPGIDTEEDLARARESLTQETAGTVQNAKNTLN